MVPAIRAKINPTNNVLKSPSTNAIPILPMSTADNSVPKKPKN